MMILFELILSILFFSSRTTPQGLPENPIICHIVGKNDDGEGKILKVDDLPKRCEIFLISRFLFDYNGTIPCTYMQEDNLNLIKTLVNAKKNVYVLVGYKEEMMWDEEIFNPLNQDTYRKTIFEPFINFLRENKISGISIRFADICDVDIADFEAKISCFVNSIKKEINTINVGLTIRGYNYPCFTNSSQFDFTKTNEVLDFYSVDLGWLNLCLADIKKIGMNPITSTDPALITYETVRCALESSCIEKSKLYGMVDTSVGVPQYVSTVECGLFVSYSLYCCSSDPINSSRWCGHTMETYHKQGAYVKQHYQGLVIFILNYDDTEGNCGCEKFPVTNSIIDGWKGIAAVTPCAKIDCIVS